MSESIKNQKKILITGGAGYIGSHLTNRLVRQGYDIHVIDRLSTGFKNSLPIEKIQFFHFDLCDALKAQSHFQSHDYDVIIHLSGSLNVAESVFKPTEYYHNNILGLVHTLKFLNPQKKTDMIFSSTSSVYGASSFLTETSAGRHPGSINSYKPFDEATPAAPINPYGESKLMCEKILKDYCGSRANFNYLVLRYFNVAGASDDLQNGQRTEKAYHLLHLAAQTALGMRESMSVYGQNYPTYDGTCIRDYLHVEDLVDAHLSGLDYLDFEKTSQILNCGYAKEVSVLEALQTMQKASGISFPLHFAAPRAGDPVYLVADNKKIKSILGWKPRRDFLPDICLSALNWEKNYQTSLTDLADPSSAINQKTVASVHQ